MFPRALTLLAAAVLCAGCASSRAHSQLAPDELAELGGSAQHGPVADTQAAITSQIEEVQDAPVPEGVDPLLFEELRSQLLEVLATRDPAGGRPEQMAPRLGGPPRAASFTPYGAANGIDDLVLSTSDGTRLSWTYRNKGDYDLNGMVNVSDLTPIGMYYGLAESDPRWLLAKAADGDDNGMITVSDITPIGQFFGGSIIGYQIWGTDDPSGEWAFVGSVTVAANLNKNPLRPRFVIEMPAVDHEYYSIWPYDNSDDGGWWSNIGGPGLPEQRYVNNMENIWQPAS